MNELGKSDEKLGDASFLVGLFQSNNVPVSDFLKEEPGLRSYQRLVTLNPVLDALIATVRDRV